MSDNLQISTDGGKEWITVKCSDDNILPLPGNIVTIDKPFRSGVIPPALTIYNEKGEPLAGGYIKEKMLPRVTPTHGGSTLGPDRGNSNIPTKVDAPIVHPQTRYDLDVNWALMVALFMCAIAVLILVIINA